MRQFDEDYLSTYRLISNTLNRDFKPVVSYLIQASGYILLFGPLTHEEGHRSILVSKNIGSISQPFFLSLRGGYISGVTDQTLQNIRDTDFPDFIRLHTAGLESDFMLNHRVENLLSFEDESYKNIAIEYILRKFSLMEYYLIGFFHYDVDGAEEKDELKRDIVGNDVYGVIRHLYRPKMEYRRYTQYKDLTPEEKKYVAKMGYKSFFNLLNPNILGIYNLRITNNLRMNLGMGHTMCPFGDFTDENLWIKYNDILKIHIYTRQYQNRSNWFPAGGIEFLDLPFTKRFEASCGLHLWNQPENLGFNDSRGKMGGAAELLGKYYFVTRHKTRLDKISIDLGINYKTIGFLPEEIYLRKHFGFRIGTSIGLDQIL
jgi:hypothetical protein